MIKLADNSTKGAVWDMWKTVFGDPDSYMELYFRTKYSNDNTLIYFENEKPVASLQMLKFNFTFYGDELPIYYLSGVCTLPEARRKGYMDKLIIESFKVAKERAIPLMLLVPQEEWLLKFYNKYGFAQTFDSGSEQLISLKELNERHKGNLEFAYIEFDSNYRGQDMTVQKSFEDFKAIMEEAALWDYPPKKSLIGMARVIDAKQLISIFAKHSTEDIATLRVIDKIIDKNNITVPISGSGRKIEMDVLDLAQLLLGYNTSEKAPQIHFMLE